MTYIKGGVLELEWLSGYGSLKKNSVKPRTYNVENKNIKDHRVE